MYTISNWNYLEYLDHILYKKSYLFFNSDLNLTSSTKPFLNIPARKFLVLSTFWPYYSLETNQVELRFTYLFPWVCVSHISQETFFLRREETSSRIFLMEFLHCVLYKGCLMSICQVTNIYWKVWLIFKSMHFQGTDRKTQF